MSPRDPLNCFFYSSLAAAHYKTGRYDEAVAAIRLALQQRPNIMMGQRMLCASLAQAGQIDEAKAAMRVLQELQPYISVTWIKESVPYTDKVMPHFLEGMRKAGVPE